MRRSSHTGYYQLREGASDSEGQETNNILMMTTSYTADNAAPSSTSQEPEPIIRRTLRSIRQKWKQREEIRSTLPTFRPWFTFIVALVNIGLFIAICITDGIADVTFTPTQEHGTVDDFEGQQVLAVREVPANFFIGPTATDLVHHGAKYATVRI